MFVTRIFLNYDQIYGDAKQCMIFSLNNFYKQWNNYCAHANVKFFFLFVWKQSRNFPEHTNIPSISIANISGIILFWDVSSWNFLVDMYLYELYMWISSTGNLQNSTV